MQARITAIIVVVALLAAACGSSNGTDGENAGGGSSVIISGSSTVEPISARVAEAFKADNPNVTVSVEGPGTGDGFKKFCGGETDISDASRPIRDSEAETCAAAGIDWIELYIAIDGISVLTSTDNDVHQCVTFSDLYALVGPESIGFTRWADATTLAQEVGGTTGEGVYVDQNLVVTAPGEESGTYDSFVEIVLEATAEIRGEEAFARPDYTASANDNVIIEGIAGSRYSLGWVGYAFYSNNEDRVAALQVDDGESGCVTPTAGSIADGSYPISRPLFIYVNANKLESNAALVSFVDYYLSDAGLVSVGDAGYVELQDYAPTRDSWDNRVTGRVFS
jgi:phosphate transport system substrate-binding protein